jgi:Domain of unknown function (DUF5615)
MRFIADIGISPSSVAALRAHGHEATHLSEIGLERAADAEILDKAHPEQRLFLVLSSHDHARRRAVRVEFAGGVNRPRPRPAPVNLPERQTVSRRLLRRDFSCRLRVWGRWFDKLTMLVSFF